MRWAVTRKVCSLDKATSLSAKIDKSQLPQLQEICLFCAFRHGVEARVANPTRQQRQIYTSSAPSRRPAGAAAARAEEEDDDLASSLPAPAPKRELQGWRCRCSHVNATHRLECTICLSPRPQKLEHAYKENGPPPKPSSSSIQSSRSASGSGEQSVPLARSRNFLEFNSQPILDQARFSFQQPERNSLQESRSYPRRNQPTHRDGSRRERNGSNKSMARNTRDASASQNGPRIKFIMGDRREPPAPALQTSTTGPRSTSWRPFAHNNHPSGDEQPERTGSAIDGAEASQRTNADAAFGERFGSRRPRGDFQRRYDEGLQVRAGPRQGRFRRFREDTSNEASHDSPQSATVDEDFVEISESEPSLQTEEESPSRRARKDKDADRRSRVYDVESAEPFTTSQMASSPTGKRRSIPRLSTPDFDPDEVEEYLDERRRGKKNKNKKEQAHLTERPEIRLPEFISVEKLAQSLKVRLHDFLEKLEEEGFEGARYDHLLDSETSAIFAEIYGYEPVISTINETRDLVARPPAENPSLLPPRPPIVTIMGHVDHGKTTLLDYFRKSSLVAREHGGITQHIGAFSVTMPGSERNITFLDTPGHAAFLEMRRRGAHVTDIVVLVVAADDSVKAQTIEAIKHALEAKVHMIVAVNKIDKEDANIERVKQDLVRHGIVVEDFGGEYQAIPVSGKTGRGMADLEEAILTLADVADFRAEKDGPAEGWIIESAIGSSGRVATVLVRRGTLRPGDFIVAGTTWARVRTLRNDAGQLIQEAPPGTPVQIDGWREGDPMAGLEVLQAESERQAKDAVAVRQEREEAARAIDNMTTINATRAEEAEARAKVLEWEKEQGYLDMRVSRRPKDNEGWVEKESSGPQQVHFVVKADVAGSVEAIVTAVNAIGNNEIVANVIHSGTGELTESDIKHLAATGEVGYAITFNQPVDNSIRRLAEATNLGILNHNVIYKITDDVKEKLSAQLPPIVTQRVLGEAEIGEIFEINIKRGILKIAGCRVTNGIIRRSEKIRVLRNGEVVYTGMLNSFKNIKKDVTEMRKGSECGMGFENWDGFQVGDQVQSFEEQKEARKLY
ncbi:translation initiation factor IF-2 [Rhinocladiella mackenziei CBS 650.93]|uniref:Translation initiation factor IF-2, mitochondrial n=1 Tax=Rhinocladiella mackenziei CBS 650.93 TaxID=1442369 RepID=A0A0D2ICR1_9EURO|nr:translation initiation factor IF-2 [Rhinocladiella mackenziei CBS 650.93]KIX01006.1 translation initiation factor IF-2 [Rhinocladiella mackenziei CBS 650.93]